MNPRLIIMLKAPQVGRVKTRLAEALGRKRALAAYERLVTTLLDRLAGLRQVELRYTPDDAGEEVVRWAGGSDWMLTPQGDGSLGERLLRAFREAFDRGDERVVVIGADCPWVTQEDVEQAWSVLAERELVLGPATDGGYWLVGLNRAMPALFDGIAWSTESVLSETVEKAAGLGLTYAVLRQLSDVDTLSDWRQWERVSGRVTR